MKIVIDPGHGGKHPGASYFGFLEKDFALSISLKVFQLLKDNGIECHLTRHSDVDISLLDRCKQANKLHADAFISIHCNASYDHDVNGIEVYKWHTSEGLSRKLANKILLNMILHTNATDRRVRNNKTFCVLRRTVMPALVVECGYMTNKEECFNLSNEQYQNKIALGIFLGIMSAFDHNVENLNGII